MPIIAYTAIASDGSLHGEVFETDKAERFEGAFCPLADGSAGTSKEDLYLVDGRHWIKNTVTLHGRKGDVAEDSSTYIAISLTEAREWMERHNYPEAVRRYFVNTKGGRPPIGERLITTVPARTHNQIAVLSEMYGEDVPDTVRRLLDEALAHRETIGAPGSRDADIRPY